MLFWFITHFQEIEFTFSFIHAQQECRIKGVLGRILRKYLNVNTDWNRWKDHRKHLSVFSFIMPRNICTGGLHVELIIFFFPNLIWHVWVIVVENKIILARILFFNNGSYTLGDQFFSKGFCFLIFPLVFLFYYSTFWDTFLLLKDLGHQDLLLLRKGKIARGITMFRPLKQNQVWTILVSVRVKPE